MDEIKVFGDYIVADPKVCHGQLTFRGTRVFVADVLEHVAQSVAWDEIVAEWRGTVSREAIAAAVLLARGGLLEQEESRPRVALAG